MSSDKLYLEHLTRTQVAQFFRELAGRLEGVVPGAAESMVPDPGGFKKIKISVKRDSTGFVVKWESKPLIKRAGVDEWETAYPADETEIRYKNLKKRLKENFRVINQSLMGEVMPGEGVVASFLQDAKMMMAFPEKGAAHYGDFEKVCLGFSNAFESKNLEACKTAGTALKQLKRECHRRYK